MRATAIICIALLIAAVSTTASAAPTPDEALDQLVQGNRRYAGGHLTHPRLTQPRRSETVSGGQHPFATVIACSDSRVPVELVFDQGIGDVFVIRVAGNVCDVDEIGSIEYGVDHLGTPVMLVLGHTGCGAVTAVCTGAEVHGSIPALVDNIAPAAARAQQITGLHGADVVPQAVRENVWQSITDLLSGSSATAARVRDGRLKVVGAIYDIDSGAVEWMGEYPGQAALLGAAGHDPPQPETHTPDPPVHTETHTPDPVAGHGATATHQEPAPPAHQPAPPAHQPDPPAQHDPVAADHEDGHGTEDEAAMHGEEAGPDESILRLEYAIGSISKMIGLMGVAIVILAIGIVLLALQPMLIGLLPAKLLGKAADGKEPAPAAATPPAEAPAAPFEDDAEEADDEPAP